MKPVANPVSASRRSYRSRLYSLIQSVVSSVKPAEVISPAACQVVPAVSWWRSRSRTSVHPALVRW